MKRVKSVFFFCALLFFSSQLNVSFANDNPYAWPLPYSSPPGPVLGYSFTTIDSLASINWPSMISRMALRAPACRSLDDPVCNSQTYLLDDGTLNGYMKAPWGISRILPPCKTKEDREDCIENVSITDSILGKRTLLYKENLPGNTWPADQEHGLGAGSTTSLWADPLSNDPAEGFAVTVLGQAGGEYDDKSFPLKSFEASIVRYQTITGSGYRGTTVQERPGGGLDISSNQATGCAWTAPKKCGQVQDFANINNISLTLHLPTSLSGWLFGRLKTPAIEISKLTPDENRITVAGSPVLVPQVSAYVAAAQATKSLTDLQLCNEQFNVKCSGTVSTELSSTDNRPFLLELRDAFIPWMNDEAKIMQPTWSFGSSIKSISVCRGVYSGFLGIVTTNSTVYVDGPPTFDGTNLDYKVWALHKTPSGSEFKGFYDLVIRSDFARCLYGFNKAPLQAEIMILSESGNSSVATTTMAEQAGWIHLAADGFTFSSPTIRTRLIGTSTSASAPILPTTQPSLLPITSTQSKQKSHTITCKKGKLVKKTSGISPKCPSGYKLSK